MSTYSNHSYGHTSSDSINNLYPALIQSFGVILLGYITGRLGSISTTESKGLSKFAINVALPAFIFRAIVIIDFSRVKWQFVLVVALAKALLFTGVAILTLLFTRNIGKAGIYGVFCTVSNDLALGVPVLNALYKDTHEDFVHCVYFLAIISVTIILPLGMLAMEFKNRRSNCMSTTICSTLLQTLKAVLKNPIVIGSLLGIPCNFIFKQEIPNALDDFFKSLSNAFPATVLFFLGLSVVGKIKAQVSMAILVPLSLVAAKVFILPLMIRALLIAFNIGGNKMNEDWSIFGFIYGTIPTAPPVAVYANAYGIQGDMLTFGMVVATFISAPVMFSSSKMTSIHKMNTTEVEFRNLLADTRNDISSVAIVMACWVIVVLLLTRRYKVPHNYTICLALTQLFLCISFVITKSETFIKNYLKLECFLITTFLFATHCWCAVLAFTLACIRCDWNHNTLLKKYGTYVFGWGFPASCSGVLLIILKSKLDSFSTEKQDFFLFLQEQTGFLAFWVTIQCVCVVICISSLLYLHRCDNYCKCTMIKHKRIIDEASPLLSYEEESKECHHCQKLENSNCSIGVSSDSPLLDECVPDIENIDEVLVRKNSKMKKYKRRDCRKLENYYEGEQHQSARHIIVIMCLNLIMIICIFYSLWNLVGDKQKSGITLEIQLLVSIILSVQLFMSAFVGIKAANKLNNPPYIHGYLLQKVFIVFLLFGFERTLLIDPLLQKLRHCWYGVDKVILPPLKDLPTDVYHICEQFVCHHRTKFLQSLTRNESPLEDIGSNTFLGSKLVDWLIEVGLVSGRITAVYYGNSLLRGHVIRHIENRYYFKDTQLVYEFCEGWDDVEDEYYGVP